MYVFGPVFSRRLGVSLGVNNVPYKLCTYSCVYCQLGRTLRLTLERRRLSDPERILVEAAERLEKVGNVDYVTFVPDGEPLLDTALGDAVRLLRRELGVRVAVLTNGSLLWLPDARESILEADYVSVKVDAGDEETWRRVDRPHPGLGYARVVEGLRVFAYDYTGVLTTETMLVSGLNDDRRALEAVAEAVAGLGPRIAYVAAPVRPPAEPWARPPPPERLQAALEALRSRGVRAEPLAAPEPPLPPTGVDPAAYVAETIKVHPLRMSYLERIAAAHGTTLEELLKAVQKRLSGAKLVEFMGDRFLAYRPEPRKKNQH